MSNLDDPSYFAVNARADIAKASGCSNQDDPGAATRTTGGAGRLCANPRIGWPQGIWAT
jgi:hypothetical protein